MPYGPSGASPSPGMENHGFLKADVPPSFVLRVPSPGTQFGHLVSPPVRSQAPTPLGPCSSPPPWTSTKKAESPTSPLLSDVAQEQTRAFFNT